MFGTDCWQLVVASYSLVTEAVLSQWEGEGGRANWKEVEFLSEGGWVSRLER